ncbi:glutamate-gated chloride channel-like, partial [Amphibalanus amphitrite]|uniref:glutamate-gated chloride channel-like n=1 Tax=Amphibalanus amphitrite TaxID=1232801 RepID=UPI001C91DF10
MIPSHGTSGRMRRRGRPDGHPVLVSIAAAIALLVTPRAAQGARSTYHESEFFKLDSLFKGKPYDRRATPTQDSDKPTIVSVEMYLRSLGSINPVEMDYTADLYLRQRWIESRFVNNSLTRPLDVSDPLLVKKIWKPEVYFPNAKSGDFQYVSVPNVLIRVHPSGEVLYILRLLLRFSCMMDLSNYPLDTQVCSIETAV